MPDVTVKLDASAVIRTIDEIRALVDRFVLESMTDPDLLSQSEDFRAGYAQGFREAIAAVLRLHRIADIPNTTADRPAAEPQ